MNKGLGRGLSSLIPQKTNDVKKPEPDEVVVSSDVGSGGGEVNIGGITEISVSKIQENPFQPRKSFNDYSLEELVASIREYGIIQPLVVTKKGDGYELIAGERRLRASREVGLKKVPVVIRSANEQEKLEIALIENVQREDLNAVETANAYQQLVDEFDMSHEEIAKKVGKSRPSVSNLIRYLNLPDKIKLALAEGRISEGHAKYLVGIESEVKQMQVFRQIVDNKMTVAETDKAVKKIGGTKRAVVKINYADKDKEVGLREFFGAKAEIKRKSRGGQIVIDFYDDDELGEIMDKIG